MQNTVKSFFPFATMKNLLVSFGDRLRFPFYDRNVVFSLGGCKSSVKKVLKTEKPIR
ncbi:hypothetical protein BSNK01_24480 [Bacillaceae bacterium]